MDMIDVMLVLHEVSTTIEPFYKLWTWLMLCGFYMRSPQQLNHSINILDMIDVMLVLHEVCVTIEPFYKL